LNELERTLRADALLATAGEHRGRLKIFLGAAPGVGKTYAMLLAARELQRQGVDVVVGLVETHGRQDTAALLEGLEVLPRATLVHRERDFTEFDLDAALARRPAVIIVDELAHRNIPGSRHERRWQDLTELLDAGIEVYTAMNVQHVESRNDQVRRITGIGVSETVPDAFIDRARDIALVDLPPRELIERLRQGKVYMPATAAAALDAFFSPTNLAALRELALETMAGHVDTELREQVLASGGTLAVRRRVVAAIDGHAQSDYLVRITRRIAERRNAPWSVVFVDTGAPLDAARRERRDASMRLARRLGGEAVILRGHAVADELIAHAEQEGVGHIVIGRTRERLVARIFGRSLTQQLLRRAAHLELTIVATPVARLKQRARPAMPGGWGHRREYVQATLASVVAFVLCFIADTVLSVANLSLVFLTAVLIVAVRTRMAVAVYTALLCFVGYNFFFAPPRYTLAIANADDLLTVVLFLVVALVCSRLATRLANQVQSLRASHAQARAMLSLGQQLTGSVDAAAVHAAGVHALAAALQADVAMLARDASGLLAVVATSHDGLALSAQERAAADWCDRHGEPAGRFTDTLNAMAFWMLPLGDEHRALGAVALRFGDDAGDLPPDRRGLAMAMAQDIGQALERSQLAGELEAARMQGETERLRSALLSSVSHDLRSPLAAMIGSADTLVNYGARLPADESQALLQSILGEGHRLDRYIQNLLDMTRLGHGDLKLQRESVPVQAIIAGALRRLRQFYPAQAVDTDLPTADLSIDVHAALIEQALFNILENAARVSPPGQPLLVSAAVADGQLAILIGDRGPGIPEEQREKIFDMFYSVSRGDRVPAGTGMGLAICRGMIGAHGGSVEAMPRSGGGTLIRVVLPLPVESVTP
jgi:two-component system sensor histidine kinase KdpD